MMEEGRIVDDGAPRALIENYGRETLEEVFLDISRRRTARPKRKPAAHAAESSKP